MCWVPTAEGEFPLVLWSLGSLLLLSKRFLGFLRLSTSRWTVYSSFDQLRHGAFNTKWRAVLTRAAALELCQKCKWSGWVEEAKVMCELRAFWSILGLIALNVPHNAQWVLVPYQILWIRYREKSDCGAKTLIYLPLIHRHFIINDDF